MDLIRIRPLRAVSCFSFESQKIGWGPPHTFLLFIISLHNFTAWLCGKRDDRSLVFRPPYRHIAYYTRSISINSPVIYLKTVGLVSFRNMKTYPLGTLDVSLSVLIVKRFFLSLCLCRPTSTSVLVRPTRRSRRFKRHWALAQRLQSKRKLLCTKYPQFR